MDRDCIERYTSCLPDKSPDDWNIMLFTCKCALLTKRYNHKCLPGKIVYLSLKKKQEYLKFFQFFFLLVTDISADVLDKHIPYSVFVRDQPSPYPFIVNITNVKGSIILSNSIENNFNVSIYLSDSKTIENETLRITSEFTYTKNLNSSLLQGQTIALLIYASFNLSFTDCRKNLFICISVTPFNESYVDLNEKNNVYCTDAKSFKQCRPRKFKKRKFT